MCVEYTPLAAVAAVFAAAELADLAAAVAAALVLGSSLVARYSVDLEAVVGTGSPSDGVG